MKGSNNTTTTGIAKNVKVKTINDEGLMALEFTLAQETASRGSTNYIPVVYVGMGLDKLAKRMSDEDGFHPIMVEGGFRTETWTDKNDKSKKVSRDLIKATRIEVLDCAVELSGNEGAERLKGGLNHAVVAGNLTDNPKLAKTHNLHLV